MEQNIIQPLKPNFKLDEDAGWTKEQIKDRVNAESWYTHCKGYENIKSSDITGRLGKPVLE